MGKSIRSKIKRKHRKEFRETIGAVSFSLPRADCFAANSLFLTLLHLPQEAFKANMDKVQVKLQECLEKGNMNSFERLSNALSTEVAEMETGNEPLPQVEEASPPSLAKGENKVPTKRRREQKHRIRKKPREQERKERRKPKYFCEF